MTDEKRVDTTAPPNNAAPSTKATMEDDIREFEELIGQLTQERTEGTEIQVAELETLARWLREGVGADE